MIAPSRARLLPRTLLRARVLALAMSASARPTPPRASRTITKTDEPIIVSLQALTRSQSDVASLAQGIVHWPPPPEALEMAAKAAADPASAAYGAAEGLPALREALRDKLAAVNGFRNSDVMVTAGREPCCNQAFANAALALLDPGDSAILFAPYSAPYYFNHLMMLQMRGVDAVTLATDAPDFLPDPAAVDAALAGERPPRAVVVVNPGNPSGALVPGATLRELSAVCARRGVWLVVDNTYEAFTYGDAHASVEGDHVVNLFSFSKAYGIMGWRVGYVAHPPHLAGALLKAQDTLAICPSGAAQAVALGALASGDYVRERVAALAANQKPAALEALAPLGPGAVCGGSGAIYLMAELPAHAADDEKVVRWLVREHGLATIPGSACGLPGFIRIAYANLPPAEYAAACERLRVACEQLADPAFVLGGD